MLSNSVALYCPDASTQRRDQVADLEREATPGVLEKVVEVESNQRIIIIIFFKVTDLTGDL